MRFYPNSRPARQWFVGRIDDLASLDPILVHHGYRVAIGVVFISLASDNRLPLTRLLVRADLMLIDVYSFFHIFIGFWLGVQ